ncbi:MAG: hypothetical protein JSR91_09215 [Proteobacteria bacterium]|nr:hypothetical protein [Pseudomonadota bacterium]
MIDAPVFAVADNLVVYAGDEVPGMHHMLLMDRDPGPFGMFILMGR